MNQNWKEADMNATTHIIVAMEPGSSIVSAGGTTGQM